MLKIPDTLRANTADKFGFVLDNLMDFQLHVILHFEGRVNETILARAVKLSLDAEPVLGSKLEYNKVNVWWRRLKSITEEDVFSTVEGQAKGTILDDFLDIETNVLKGPMVHVRLFRGAVSDAICIKISHFPTDGASIKEYTYLLAHIYRKLDEDPSYIPEPNITGSRSTRQLTSLFTLSQKLKILGRTFKDNKAKKTFWRVLDTNNNDGPAHFAIRQIPPAQFYALKAYAKERKATVQDMLMASYYRALDCVAGQSPHGLPGIMSTSDNRRHYMPGGKAEGTCNLSGFYYSSIGRDIGKDFDDTLKRVKAELDELKRNYIGLGDYLPVRIIMNWLPFSLSRKVMVKMMQSFGFNNMLKAGLTNLGIIDKEKVNFGLETADAYILVPFSRKPSRGVVVGITSFKNTLTIGTGIKGNDQAMQEVVRLLGKMFEELMRLPSK